MGEIPRSKGEHVREEQLPNPDFIVKHGGEPLVDIFNKTLLENAPVHPVPDTYEEFIALKPTRKRKWLKPVAILSGAVALGAGAMLVSGGSDNSKPEAGSETPTSTPATPNTLAPSTSGIPDESSPNTIYNPNIPNENEGNMVIARIREGDGIVTATRPDGSEINVPRLRVDAEPNLFAESALALIACYTTTGSEVCLDELSNSPQVRDYLETFRNSIEASQQGIKLELQTVIYDDESAPAEFIQETVDGRERISLVAGSLYLVAFDDDSRNSFDWQTPAAREHIENRQTFYQLDFYLDNDGEIVEVYYETE